MAQEKSLVFVSVGNMNTGTLTDFRGHAEFFKTLYTRLLLIETMYLKVMTDIHRFDCDENAGARGMHEYVSKKVAVNHVFGYL